MDWEMFDLVFGLLGTLAWVWVAVHHFEPVRAEE